MASILHDRYGFEVKTLKDQEASDRGITDALSDYIDHLPMNSNLLIYYAGHGTKVENIPYWIPANATVTKGKWLPVDQLTTKIRDMTAAHHILVISDSCFAGKMRDVLSVEEPPQNPEERQDYLQKNSRPKSRTYMTSGGDEPVSDVGYSNHSIFAYYLLDALKFVAMAEAIKP
jgi:uncharacterized caspase-like protein